MSSMYKIHFPTESYGFIEYKSEDRDDAIREYYAIKAIFEDKVGHNQKEWARVRNDYANKGEISIEDLEGCNKSQRYFINEMKLVFKSVNKDLIDNK